jgi:hypothetical protein
MTRRLIAFALLCLSCSAVQAHADDFPAPTVPPGLEAMWNGRDGAAVLADLRRIAAEGERPGTSASQKMDAGECAYWLGVQEAREGRPDSALTQWRRALVLRGDFPEGFALIDALCRRGRPGDFAEARVQAEMFAQQTLMSMQQRAPEAHARLAWALHLLGRPDSAMAELRTHCPTIYRRPFWTRRFIAVALAAGDHASAWDACVTLSARTRRRDAEAETLLVSCQRSLGYDNERRQRSMDSMLGRALAKEEVFAHALGGTIESIRARDGFRLQLFSFPAARLSARRAPLLFVLSPTDTIAAIDSLVAAVTRAGHPVALLAPRGSFGSLGRGAWGPEAWIEQRAALEALVVADAGGIIDQLSQRATFAGRGGWIVGAGGERASVALEVARARHNVAALVLVAPRVPSVAVAEFRARLRAIGTRTFVQISPEEADAMEFGELLVRDTAPGQVRVADSGRAGRGAAIFRGETKVAERLLAWLAEKPRKK